MSVSIDGVVSKKRKKDKFESDFVEFIEGTDSLRRTAELLEEAGKLIRKRYADAHNRGLLERDYDDPGEDNADRLEWLVCEYEEQIETERYLAGVFFHSAEIKYEWCDYPKTKTNIERRIYRMRMFLVHVRIIYKKTKSAKESTALFMQAKRMKLEDGCTCLFSKRSLNKIRTLFVRTMKDSRDQYYEAAVLSDKITIENATIC